MTEDQLRGIFREMRDEPVPPDSQVRVRLAVAERSRSPIEKFRRRWKIATAILLPACAALIAVLLWEPARIRKPAVAPPAVAQQTEARAIVPAIPEPPRKISRLPRGIVRPVRRFAIAGNSDSDNSATVIRIETPDPNVVILLVGG